MTLAELAVSGVLVVFLLIATALFSSKTLTEHMVRRGVLPHMFLELIPVIMLGARLLAVAMILIGVVRILAVSGLLSGEWVAHYGLAALLVVFGVVLLGISFGKRRQP
jgi:hypothetical protein